MKVVLSVLGIGYYCGTVMTELIATILRSLLTKRSGHVLQTRPRRLAGWLYDVYEGMSDSCNFPDHGK